MAAPQLITLAQIQQFKSLTSNLNTAKSLEQQVMDAQEFDLRALLGAELYLDLCDAYEASPSLAAPYADLYNGCDYEVNGRRNNHGGIVAVLAHFAYARYVENANTHSTKSGFKTKVSDWSQEPSKDAIARRIQQARSAAIAMQDRLKHFLDNHTDDYPQWRGGKKRRRTAMRITAVGGNSRTKKNYNPDCCDVRTVTTPCDDSEGDYVNSGYVL